MHWTLFTAGVSAALIEWKDAYMLCFDDIMLCLADTNVQLLRPEYGPEPIYTTCWKMLNSWGAAVGYSGFFYLPTNNTIDCGAFSNGQARALLLDPSKMPEFKS